MDKELIILEQIQNNPQVKQRDLATVAQVSLGMTNAILKRFVEKGFVTIQKVNNRNIRYALTSVGMNEIKDRSWKYFKRTIKNVVVYQDAITEIILRVKENGYIGISLVGKSDFMFMIEHICSKKNVIFECSQINDHKKKWFYFIAETEGNKTLQEDEESFHLNRLIVK